MSNYTYAIDLATRLTDNSKTRLLDYGCGAGQIVELALEAGLDAYGVDEFYEGGSYRDEAKKKGLFQSRIFELQNGKISFPDESFDIIVSNQVFEHIDDFSVPLGEIYRVMKTTGIFINIFPSSESWREGHIGIPFAHWFPKGSRLRFWYVCMLRMLGMGYYKGEKSVKKWAADQLEWIDKWTHYKPLSEIKLELEKNFFISFYDYDYMLANLKRRSWAGPLHGLLATVFMRPILTFICEKYASKVFVLRKKP